MEKEIIRLEHINYTSNGHQIINDVSMSVSEGTTTVITGRAGSGKSSLLKIMASILIPDSGNVCYSPEIRKNFRKKSGFVFSDSALWSNSSIYDNISLPLQVHFPKMNRNEILERIDEVCEIMDFHPDLKLRPADFSEGQQKTISFMRALIHRPDIIFMENPLKSLDFETINRVIKLIGEIKNKKSTLVITTSMPEFTSAFGDVVFTLKDGKI